MVAAAADNEAKQRQARRLASVDFEPTKQPQEKLPRLFSDGSYLRGGALGGGGGGGAVGGGGGGADNLEGLNEAEIVALLEAEDDDEDDEGGGGGKDEGVNYGGGAAQEKAKMVRKVHFRVLLYFVVRLCSSQQ